MTDLLELAERVDVERVVKTGCTAAEVHLTCSYPTCKCKAIPIAIRAALAAMPVAEVRETVIEECAQVADGYADSAARLLGKYAAPRAIQAAQDIAGKLRALKAQPASMAAHKKMNESGRPISMREAMELLTAQHDGERE